MSALLPLPSDALYGVIPLRDYQSEGVARVRSRIASGKRRIVFVLGTGGGKTVVASAIVAGALAKGKRCLFCAHRRELIRQTFCKLLRNGLRPESIGIVMAGTPARSAHLGGETPLQIVARMRAAGASDPAIDCELWGLFGARRAQAPIQVASIDSLRSKSLGHFDLVILDECHRARSPSYVSLITAHWDTAVILGLTATPWPPPGKSLGDVVDGRPLFDDLVPPVKTTRELSEMGFLVAPRMFGVPPSSLPDMSEARIGKDGEWVQEDLEKASSTDKLVGDIVDHWQRRAEGLRTVVFASGVEHSKKIAAAFCAAGVKAEHLDGTTDVRLRDAILSRLDSGETTVVCQCDVLTTGWDQPSVAVLVFARMTRSRTLAKQMMGRGLRPHPDKPFVLFLDHAGVLAEHDGPLAEEEYSIVPSRKKRKASSLSIKTCPSCFAIVPANTRVCSELTPAGEVCGHVFGEAAEREDPEEEAGELAEVEDVPREVKRAAFDRLCAERGNRQPGWVYQQYLETFKTKPPKAWKVPLHDEERPENNPAVMETWREIYQDPAFAAHGAASGRFNRAAGFWPNGAMLDERRAWLEGGADLETQLRASVSPEASPAPVPTPAPAPDSAAIRDVAAEGSPAWRLPTRLPWFASEAAA